MMGRIYEVHRSDGLAYQDMNTIFNRNWLRSRKLIREIQRQDLEGRDQSGHVMCAYCSTRHLETLSVETLHAARGSTGKVPVVTKQRSCFGMILEGPNKITQHLRLDEPNRLEEQMQRGTAIKTGSVSRDTREDNIKKDP